MRIGKYASGMAASLDTFVSDGRVVISFAESAVSPVEREDFIARLKAEWSILQNRLTGTDAAALAEEIDRGWWAENREQILRRIGEQ